ncbi:hypothetical protein R1flu_012363 [Riccia fluitans]|uniref:Uncharacterized protein n=1 Tax=Riccia fluitans TaxID=41844 RepID=A0ABD1ZAQ6_9MARC
MQWQDIAPRFGFSLTHSQLRSKGWVVDGFKKFSLEGHPDGYALDKQAAHNNGEALELKRELEAKQEELKRLQEADKKIRQILKVARRKGKELEDELKTMPIVLDCYRGEALLQKLCDVNTALNLHLRPWDGLFVDCFASVLLSIPWVANLLKSLAEKRFVTLWTTRHMTLESLQSPKSYKTDTAHKVLAPLFALSKIWKCDHLSSSTQGTTKVDHACVPPPELPRNSSLWLVV